MLYLITGANGAGKTLNALKWVRERSVKENRPVAHNGRFEPVEGGELSSWKKIEAANWQDEPDGTIFLIDECHNDFPLRPPSSSPPEHVRMLAEHRRRGFDFYLITQHPQNIDSFVRRLIGSPGWHRHLKRTFGADLVSVLEWPAVNPNCEKAGSGKSGTVTMQAFPKDVFSWYKSASLHTGKKTIPKPVFYLAVLLILIPLLLWFAYGKIGKIANPSKETAPTALLAAAPEQGALKQRTAYVDAQDYIAVRTPRIKTLPHTAPVYDEVTKAKQAPYPAACVSMGQRCVCYSQQATQVHVDLSVCREIVEKGFFVEWQEPSSSHGAPEQITQAKQEPEPQKPVLRTVPVPEAEPVVRSGTRADWAAQLAARNSQVRSALKR